MLKKLRLQLTYANVVSSAALFLALGGVSYAAVALPKNSVGAKQIKTNAVTGAKVKNGTLVRGDFKKGQVADGARGAQGPQGLRGLQGVTGSRGPSGVSGAHVVEGPSTMIAAVGGFASATVTCPAGERVLSGNYTQADGIPSDSGLPHPHQRRRYDVHGGRQERLRCSRPGVLGLRALRGLSLPAAP